MKYYKTSVENMAAIDHLATLSNYGNKKMERTCDNYMHIL